MAGGFFGMLERVFAGNNPVGDQKKFGRAGEDLFRTGTEATNRNLDDLRRDLGDYERRLKNPLGEEGESIFRRARGQMADDSVRRQRSFASRLTERARQSGGSLSPQAMAELEQQTQRDLGESEFAGEFNLAREHAGLVLAETNRLFDRRADIRKTMLGISESDKLAGIQMWLNKLNLQQGRNAAIGQSVAAISGTVIGGAGVTGGAGSTTTNPATGRG